MEQAGTWREVADPGTGVIFEDSDGGRGAFEVDLDALAEAVDGGGVCDLQREVARMVEQVLEGSQCQLQLEKPACVKGYSPKLKASSLKYSCHAY